jgi:HPt (histidine-containing phosphotransfer) domain-containing protein
VTDRVEEAFRVIQREYMAEMPDRLRQLRARSLEFRAGDPAATGALRMALHRLAGSAGSYGFPAASAVARELERWIGMEPAPAEADRLDQELDRLEAALRLPTA